jgi:hypothetical protein
MVLAPYTLKEYQMSIDVQDYDRLLAYIATAPDDDREFEAWLSAHTVELARRRKLAARSRADRKRARHPTT